MGMSAAARSRIDCPERGDGMLKLLNDLLWGPGTLALFLGTGAWLSLRTAFFPQRKLGTALRLSLGRAARRKGSNGVSAFGSLMTALASTIGTGNIVGVATALVSGGPGALVWMEAAAFLGFATKFAECMLAVKYHRIAPDGTRWGGPMAVMEARMGSWGRLMGRSFAFAALLMSFTMGAMAQSGAMADTFAAAFSVSRWRVGAATALLALVFLLGGIRRVARISTILVPLMAVLYVGGGVAVIWENRAALPGTLLQMLHCAAAPKAILGGALGTVSRRAAIRNGVARGVFSNEAGLGSAAIAAACADTDSPVRQGLISMTGVFFDTTVICTLTGLAICVSGVLGTVDSAGLPLTGAALTLRAFETALGPWSGVLLVVSLGLFAFTSVLGCAVQGEAAISYLSGPRLRRPYHAVYALAVLAGALLPLDTVLQLSDLANACMALPNLVTLLLLSGELSADLRKFTGRKV